MADAAEPAVPVDELQRSGAPDVAKVRLLLTDMRAAVQMVSATLAAQVTLLDTLQRDLEAAVEGDFNDASTALPPPTAHRREHRPGPPPRIDSDPELQAFIAARVDRLTFDQIAREVAEHFPPKRRAGRTAIWEWWRKTRSPSERKRP